MHPRERVLEFTKRLREKDKALPIDLVVQAEQLGLFVSALEEPVVPALSILKSKAKAKDKEYPNGKKDVCNPQRNRSLSVDK